MSREMKYSGIAWIGEIPKRWNVLRLKNLGFLYGGLTGKSGDDFVINEDEPCSYMYFIPFTNIFNNDVIDTKQLYKVKTEEGEQQNLVNKYDILFLMSSEDNDGVGKPAIIEEQVENLGLNSFCKGLRITSNQIYPKFLYYLLSSHIIRELIRQEARGFIRINLRQDKLSCCPIFLPPLAEQKAIADFLDKKCNEIDELVALQEKMIEELKAYKQSVITEAVCKGLNPNVPMKDSGVECIGEIPEGWSVMRLKNKYLLRTGTTPDNFEDISEENVNWFTPSDIKEEGNVIYQSERKLSCRCIKENKIQLFPKGSLVFVGIGASAGKIGYAEVEGYCNQQITALIPQHGVYSKYFYYFMCADKKRLKDNAFYTTLPIINNSYLSQNKIIVPPLAEQQEIADYLDKKCSEIDQLISIKQQKIVELNDYKKSLIYEYTTGKKEVKL